MVEVSDISEEMLAAGYESTTIQSVVKDDDLPTITFNDQPIDQIDSMSTTVQPDIVITQFKDVTFKPIIAGQTTSKDISDVIATIRSKISSTSTPVSKNFIM